jgi:poly(3-hydroxybutyrate) depolymerase
MLYHAYEAKRRVTAPLYGFAALGMHALESLPRPLKALPHVRAGRALSGTLLTLNITHMRPEFGINNVSIETDLVGVQEKIVLTTPFGSLLHFEKAGSFDQAPVLIVPALAGHFATLVRDTVRTFLPDHDVYVAEWHNGRDIPAREGRFGLDEFIEHVIDFAAVIGPGVHMVAVCQPCVPVLAAAAIMAAEGHEAEPRSLVLMAGPVDARINPGPVNEFASRTSLERLKRMVITQVPWPFPGHGRRVYPGFLQAAAFIGLDPKRHVRAFAGLFADLANDAESARRTQEFYAEYFAVLDIAEEFYLDTTRVVFKDHDMALERMQWRGRPVEPAAINTALMTVEAERDEICPPGQTEAAHKLCPGIPARRRRHHLQSGVGHYGVFSGSRFHHEIYPQIRSFIAAQS